MTVQTQDTAPGAVEIRGAKPRRLDWKLLAQRILALIVIFALWELGVRTGIFPSMAPSVIDVITSIFTVLANPAFWSALINTLAASTTGWLIACASGIVLGLLIGTIRPLDRSTSLVVEFGRAFPTIALMPVVMLLLGATMTMEITMVVLAAVWPVLVQSILGSRRLDPNIVDTVKIFRIPKALWFTRVLLPSALPFIATGVRISASIAILAAVGVEVLTQVPGLGRLITLAQEAQRWDLAFAYLFYAGIFGWLIATLLNKGEGRLLAWNRRSDD
ncbi:MAG: ABC transporter permease [Gulosibacter sp.]|uniref:ABC transporter permease n=1 Tax=Gulosibacter sp. TaxID=2817531 RepID=UPI003F92FD80